MVEIHFIYNWIDRFHPLSQEQIILLAFSVLYKNPWILVSTMWSVGIPA